MSRPKINPTMRRKDLNITLPPTLISKAKEYAEMSGESVSVMVEVSLGDFLDRLETELKKQPPFPRHPVRPPALSTAFTGKAIS